MLETHWFGLVGFAFLMTLAWLFIERRIVTTAGLSGLTWALAALSGGSLTRITQTGEEIAVSVDELQYLCTLMALLSILALVLYEFDQYPPGSDDPMNPDQQAARAD